MSVQFSVSYASEMINDIQESIKSKSKYLSSTVRKFSWGYISQDGYADGIGKWL